jgi:ribonuclease BN (tRNA processing enzyme)
MAGAARGTTEGVRVRLLGSGDAFGSGGRLQTCILVESNGDSCLLDCGASSLIALKRADIDPNGIGAILITHLHGDHFGGLPFFILDRQFSGCRDRLRIAGPPGLQARLIEAMEIFFPGSSAAQRRFEIQCQELPEGVPASVGPFLVTPYEALHACGAPAYALRVEIDGRVVAYSGDTAWTERLVTAASGADLFVCESSFYDRQVPFHLDYATLMEHRSELDCRRLVLTHMSSEMLSHLPDLEVETAHDGLEIIL